MTRQVKEILRLFDRLSDCDKQEVATEILRRELAMDIPPLSDNDLVGAAEEVFLQLDSREESDSS